MLIIRSIQLSILLTSYIISLHGYSLDTFYGTYETQQPVIQALLEDSYFQRLKKIHQYGPRQYAIKNESYTRFDHSVGVLYLLNRFGAELDEQIAGLLHDVSHTVFSHVGDLLFNRKQNQDAYQDEIHAQFIAKTSLKEILQNYGFTVEQIACNKEQYLALEQNLPDICADRLEYNLQGGFVHGIISKEEINFILDNLRYEDKKWYFTSVEAAVKFAQLPLILMEEVWSSPENNYIYEQTSTMLMRALAIGEISEDDIHYGTDDAIWSRLAAMQDTVVQNCYASILAHKEHIVFDEAGYTKHYKAKFRGIDPLVKINNVMARLTSLDEQFAAQYHAMKVKMAAGYRIKIV